MCANPLLPMEKEFNMHDQTGGMNTSREWSTSFFFLDLKSLGQGLAQKSPFVHEGTKDSTVLIEESYCLAQFHQGPLTLSCSLTYGCLLQALLVMNIISSPPRPAPQK